MAPLKEGKRGGLASSFGAPDGERFHPQGGWDSTSMERWLTSCQHGPGKPETALLQIEDIIIFSLEECLWSAPGSLPSRSGTSSTGPMRWLWDRIA